MEAARPNFLNSAEVVHADLVRRMSDLRASISLEEERITSSREALARAPGTSAHRVTWNLPHDDGHSEAAVCSEDERSRGELGEAEDDEDEDEMHPLGRSAPLPKYIAPHWGCFCSEYQQSYTPSLRDSRGSMASSLACVRPAGMYTSEYQASYKAPKPRPKPGPKSSKSSKRDNTWESTIRGTGQGTSKAWSGGVPVGSKTSTLLPSHPPSFLLSGAGLRRLHLGGLDASKLVAGKGAYRVLGLSALTSRPFALDEEGHKGRWIKHFKC